MALTVAATGLLGSGPVVSVAAADLAPVGVTSCLTGPANTRVRGGYGGIDPNDLSRAATRSAQQKLATKLRARGLSVNSKFRLPRVKVDVYVHVITEDNGEGGVTKAAIKKQIAVLNAGYSGRTYRGSAPTVFKFVTKSIDYTRNSDWYDWADPDSGSDLDDAEAKAAMHRGGWDDLNIYITGLSDGLLGYSTFPDEGSLINDGVVLLDASLPGGTAEPYNEGDTATHEVGHWLGLFHTFENGCTAPGDLVSDTPYQADGPNILECTESFDTCLGRGKDPVHNFMSYGDDPCLDRFTPGQSMRMTLAWVAYRAHRSNLS